MSVTDCFNVIVVQEAPRVFMDDTEEGTLALSLKTFAGTEHEEEGRFASFLDFRKSCSVLTLHAVSDSGTKTLCVLGLCFVGSWGYRHATCMTRPTLVSP